MNFANLTPAERMKASGLIGLIVVVIFFVSYTMMGALGGKKPATNPPAANGPDDQTAISAPAGPITAAQGGPVDPSKPFPIGAAKDHQSSTQNMDLYPSIDDPFRPTRTGKTVPSAAAISAMHGGTAPNVAILPANRSTALPMFGQQ